MSNWLYVPLSIVLLVVCYFLGRFVNWIGLLICKLNMDFHWKKLVFQAVILIMVWLAAIAVFAFVPTETILKVLGGK